MQPDSKILAGAAILALAATSASAGMLRFTIEAPGIQSTQLNPGVYTTVTETFDGLPGGGAPLPAPYEVAVGDYRRVQGGGFTYLADSLGGAGGTGTYVSQQGVGSLNALVLHIADSQTDGPDFSNGPGQAVGYFGFWWSAVEAVDEIVVHMADNTSQSFTGATLLSSGVLQGSAGDAASGVVNGHYGNPNNTSPTMANQAFAFLNIYAMNALSKITLIDFQKGIGSAFESDNHTIVVDLIKPVDQTGTTVPEPGTALLLAPALGMLGWMRRRRSPGA